jgi:monovalent cation/hydrogen antiporter
VNGVQVLLIVAIGIAISAVARGRGLQPGVLIVTLAAVASFLPGMPRLELDGELILALVVPPLLYSAARNVSVTGFGSNLRAILSLGVTLVVLTAAVLGLLSSVLLPSIGLAAAFTLGTVLAPPDTITTVSHGDEFGMPRRVKSILAGESLVNDATALTLFSIALAAADGGETGIGRGVGQFLYNAGAGVVVGAVLGTGTLLVRKRLGNPTLETTLVLLVPFTAYLAAEEVHASGILAVVVAAFAISVNLTLDPQHQYPGAHRTRLQEEAFWPVVDFLLETFVFAYIGLQLRFVLSDLADGSEPGLVRTLLAALVLLVAAIAVRIIAVYGLFGNWALQHWQLQRLLARDPIFRRRHEERLERRRRRTSVVEGTSRPPNRREALVVGWTGMRGILTLAAAAAVPATTASGEEFPGRDAIAAIALFVTLGTLLLQGTTLPVLIRRLNLDTEAERVEAAAMRERGLAIAGAAIGPDGPGSAEDFDLQRAAVGTAVMQGEIDEDTARRLIGELDLRQAAADMS